MTKPLLTSAGISWLKLLACLLMFADHLNKYWWGWRYDWVFESGRLAMPIFVMVMAHHLARWSSDWADGKPRCKRLLYQLLVMGAISSVPYIGLGRTGPYLADGWLPLNVLFALAAGVGVFMLWKAATPLGWGMAGVVFLAGGAVVEYGWWLLLLMVASIAFFRQPGQWSLTGLLLALAALQMVNQNAWAILAIVPMMLVILYGQALPALPRMKWVFYAFYPVHLSGIWVVKAWVLWPLGIS